MIRPHGNTLVITLLILAMAAIVGLCFAPLQLRHCGHRCSLVDRWFSKWKPHNCSAKEMLEDLRGLETYLEDIFPDDARTYESEARRHKFFATLMNGHWQIRVERTPDLPGWHLFAGDGKVHFSEKSPATQNDVAIDRLPP